MNYRSILLAGLLGCALAFPALAQDENVAESAEIASTDADAARKAEVVEILRERLGDSIADQIAKHIDDADDASFASINISSDGMTGISGAEATIAILAISLSLGMPIIILLMILYFSYRKRRQRVDLIQSFVNAGKDVPPQLLNEEEATDPLRSGINLTVVGAVLIIALHYVGAREAAVFGLIPLAIGVSRLGYHFMSERKDQR